MKILYIGPLWRGGTCLQRMVAMQELGHEVEGVDTTAPNLLWERMFFIRLVTRLGCPPDLARANHKILSKIKINNFDVLWVDKGLTISPYTLRIVKQQHPACQLVSYSPDDMLNPRNQSRRYLKSLPLYDLHVTTKSYNVEEIKALGARDVFFVGNSYDPHTHRPISLTEEERSFWGAEAGFIGDFEQARYQRMLVLAEAGIQVTVRGPNWKSYLGRQSKLIIKPGWVLGEDYTKAICATKINLCFLRKVNRDVQTTRSIEIPACGAFMLAERTDEHLSMFEEGKEAEFFSDEQELIAKTKYYLEHSQERECIAAAGRKRCIISGYSNHDRLRKVLEYLQLKKRF